MATIFYVRERGEQNHIISNREIPVGDLMRLYGSAPTNYTFIKGADSPYIKLEGEPAAPYSDPAHVVVKIEPEEVNQDTFPEQGYYSVSDVRT
jgi:hypothetical protein